MYPESRWMRTAAMVAVLMSWPHTIVGDEPSSKKKPTPTARESLDRGLAWLAKNQGESADWGTNDLGLVALGALAFMADGHKLGEGEYGKAAERALKHVLSNARDSGLLCKTTRYRQVYNHGFATFVLGQATSLGWKDGKSALKKAVDLSLECRCEDGGWDYKPRPQRRGHDLSILSVQIGGLKSAERTGIKLPDAFDADTLDYLRGFYAAKTRRRFDDEKEFMKHPGQFFYTQRGGPPSVAMAAAGAVSLSNLGAVDDWRAQRSLAPVNKFLDELRAPREGRTLVDPYTLFYITQAIHLYPTTIGNDRYKKLRDHLIAGQVSSSDRPERYGVWRSHRHVGGMPGELFATSVACLALAMPEKRLPMWRKK